MKKIFTKISLLFIGLMLCAGNAWGQMQQSQEGYHYEAGVYTVNMTMNMAFTPTLSISFTNATATLTSIDEEAVNSYAEDGTISYFGYDMPGKRITIPASITVDLSDLKAAYELSGYTVEQDEIVATVTGLDGEINSSYSLPTYCALRLASTSVVSVAEGSSFINIMSFEVPESLLSAYTADAFWSTYSSLFTTFDAGEGGGETPDPDPTPVVSPDEGDFGEEGNNLHWAFDGEHTLTISGSGAMENFEEDSFFGDVAPWMDYKSSIQTVVIENGVSTVGQYAFIGCSAMETLTIPSSLITVDVYAMEGCSGLTTINAESAISPCSLSAYAFGFSGLSQEITVNIPMGYAAAYEAAWSNVQGNFNFVEAVSDAVEFTNGNATTTIDALIAHKSETFTDFTMARPIQANGKLNTLCLPFNLSKEQIANSDLADATIYEFTGEGNITASSWDLEFTSVSTVKAGTPYLFAFEDADPSTPNLTKLVFHDVTIVSNVEDLSTSSATYNNIIFKGTLNATNMTTGGHTYYFLGENNTLIWATGGSVYPFRAYFEDLAPGTRPINAPARIVLGRNTATAIENTNTKDFDTKKILENNQVIIIRNGVRYNVAGQIVK